MTRRLLIAVTALLIVAALAYGASAWWHSLSHVSTDDAYVESPIAQISAKVAGHVVELRVVDNQRVKAGDLLLRIDPRDYEARRAQAEAAVGVAAAAYDAARSEAVLAREVTRAQADEARAAVEAARVTERSAEAVVIESQARVEARLAAVAALRAEVTGARSAAGQAQREADRMRRLVQEGYVSQREFDQADGAAATAAAALEAAQRRQAQAEREVEQFLAEVESRRLAVAQARERIVEARAALARAESQRHQVTVKEAEIGRAQARLSETKADLALAELQVQSTEVRAPVDGMVAKRGVEHGQLVQAGQPLMAVVPLHDAWVLANFKETQLERIRPGMPAEVRVDTFPGKVFHGVVDSMSAGTGARFSLLPPENATGNWVKVVQRIPVKIRLDGAELTNPHTLRAGMSALVTVRVR
jgi:membrane fusion protein (multidrug efflux system)